MQIVLPFLPPSVNRCYRTTNNRIYKSKIYTDYSKQMDIFLKERNDEKITGHVSIDVTFYKSNKRSFDLDNRLKALLDSIQNRLIENDDNVCEIHCRKFNNCTKDKTLLIIKSFDEERDSDN